MLWENNCSVPLTLRFVPLAGIVFTFFVFLFTMFEKEETRMKVRVSYIGPDQTEEAQLFVRQGHPSLKELVQVISQESYRRKSIAVSLDGKQYQLDCRHILYFESADEKTAVHTNCKQFFSKKRLYELEETLPEDFVRISKSAILNLDQVECYSPQLNGIMKAVLKNGTEVYISRQYLKKLRYRIGG